MFDQKKSHHELMLGAIVGGTLGALTTLLLSSKEGKRLQKAFKQKLNEFKHSSEVLEAKKRLLTAKSKIKIRLNRKLKKKFQAKPKTRLQSNRTSKRVSTK